MGADDYLRASSLGRNPGELDASLGDDDESALESQIAHFDVLRGDLSQQRDEKHAVLSDKRHEFDQMDGSAASAVAFAQAQTELAKIVRLAEQYMATELASQLLRQQVGDFMTAQQAPLMDRARPWFTRLTCGYFSTLETDLDEKGEMV